MLGSCVLTFGKGLRETGPLGPPGRDMESLCDREGFEVRDGLGEREVDETLSTGLIARLGEIIVCSDLIVWVLLGVL